MLYKLLEKLVLDRLLKWTKDNDIVFPNPQQSAYQKHRSCVSTAFVLQETIQHLIERHSKVYACFLDTSKAFDTVWHNGLFYKLFRFGVEGKLWRLIKSCYTNATSCVVVNDVRSAWFPLKQSVRQGGVLSTWLYLLFINELLDKLDGLGVGAKLDDLNCGSPCHADDLTLVTIRKYGLDRMLTCCKIYSTKWRYDYNGEKCSVVVFGESARQWALIKPSRKWFLGDDEIDESSSCIHLGVLQDKYSNSSKNIISAAQKLKNTLMSVLGPGIQPAGFNPISSFKLYNSVCLPRALYACEIWDVKTEKDNMILERAHRFCLKRMQGFPRLTRTAVAQAMLGSPSMQGIIDEKRLQFLRQLVNMGSSTPSALPWSVFKIRYKSMLERSAINERSLGLVPVICDTVGKYDISEFLERAISDPCDFPQKGHWRSIIKTAIKDRENINFLECCSALSHPSLQRIQRIEKSLDSPSLVWIAAQHDPVNKSRYSFISRMNTLLILDEPIECINCTQTYSDPQLHFFCGCSGLSSSRDTFWERVTNECSVILSAFLWSLSDQELTEVLLGRQLDFVSPQENLDLLKIVAETWTVKN